MIPEKQAQEAIDLNERNLNVQAMQRVRCLLGLQPHAGSDGALAVAAAHLQHRRGLTVDGEIGPQTLGALEEVERDAWRRLKRVCLYWDLPASMTASQADQLAARVAGLGIEHVQTMLDSTSDDREDWSEAQLTKWAIALNAAGVSHGLTIWAMPDAARMAERRRELSGYLGAARATVFGLDVEEHAVRERLDGYPSRAALTEDMIALVEEHGTARATMVSSYPDLLGVEDTTAAQILARADYAEMQCYGRASKAGGEWTHPRYGVATAQHWGLGRYRERIAPHLAALQDARAKACEACVRAAPHVVAALASWGQSWPASPGSGTPEEARYLAALAAVCSGADWLSDWSAKHCLGFAGSVADRAEKARYNRAFYQRLRKLRGVA